MKKRRKSIKELTTHNPNVYVQRLTRVLLLVPAFILEVLAFILVTILGVFGLLWSPLFYHCEDISDWVVDTMPSIGWYWPPNTNKTRERNERNKT